MKNSKSKLITIITTMVVAVAVIVASVAAILAAVSQTVTSNFSVTYQATDVAVTVRANTIVGETTEPMKTESGESVLIFTPDDDESNEALSPEGDIVLTKANRWVVFEYIFENNSNSIDANVALTQTTYTLENVDVSYAYSYSQITDVANMATTDAYEPMVISGTNNHESAYDFLYVYVKAKITNIADDAEFSGSITFNITKTDNPVVLTFANIENATNATLLQPRLAAVGTTYTKLPIATFADGTELSWYSNEELVEDNYVNRTYVVEAESTLYAGEILVIEEPYLITETGNTTTIQNVSNNKIYVSAPTGTTFSYGKAEQTVAGEQYLVVEPNASVKIIEETANGVAANAAAENIAVLTEQPADLDTKLFYAAYGEYPQTYVGNTLNEELKSATLTETTQEFTTDINGTPTYLKVYDYNGTKYARLESAKMHGSSVFSTNDTIINGEIYYFYIEPIVVRARQLNADGIYIVMTTNVLGSKQLDSTANGHIWETAIFRTYLNEIFLLESGLTNIVIETTIENNITDNYEDGSGTSTTDKIWLASAEELLTWSGAGDELANLSSRSVSTNSEQRKQNASDMALATYVIQKSGVGAYFLRSAGRAYTDVCCVSTSGYIESNDGFYYPHYGFCPTFAVSL